MSLTSLDFARDFASSSLPTKATFSTGMRNAESDLLIKGPIYGDAEVFKRNGPFVDIMSEDVDERPPVIKLQNESKDRSLGSLAHILGPLVGFLAPVLIYATYNGDDEFLKSHIREATNASLTFLIAAIVHSFLFVILIGCLTFPVHWLMYIIWAINANSALNAGQEYNYPLTIRFIS